MDCTLGSPLQHRDQDYGQLRDACLKCKSLFEDPEFPAQRSSIGLPADTDPARALKWLRPKEINKNAKFIEGTASTNDICQGQLGDCWLLAALSCLTLHQPLFANVVPNDQELSEPYAGIFHFRFWQYGQWVDVVVDDRLPVQSGRLLFSYSRTQNEFWSALLEKAYAKLNGCYASLKGGNITEAMEDFTGGIARSLSVASRTPAVLWRALGSSLSRGTMLSCFIQAVNRAEVGMVTPEGLVRGHAYAITATDVVKDKKGEVCLLRLRNPWGFVEYCGPWSDNCKEWDEVDNAEKQRIALTRAEDGEFWIKADYFSSLFTTVEMCSLNPDALDDTPSSWRITSHQGAWVPGCSAGGSRKYRRTFWTNPQYRLVVSQLDHQDVADENDDDAEEQGGLEEDGEEAVAAVQTDRRTSSTVVVELLQKHCRQKDKINFMYIAFHIYRVPPELQDDPSSLKASFFSSNKPVSRSGKYQAQRGTRRKVRLPPGNYVIVASTFKPNIQGSFFVRIFAQAGNELESQGGVPCSSEFSSVVLANPIAPDDRSKVQVLFKQQAGLDNRLNAVQFNKLLNSGLEESLHLSLETCRGLIFGQDTGGTGTLSLAQTEQLVAAVNSLQAIFSQFDTDSSGTMSSFELSLALQAAGFLLDPPVLQQLWLRHGTADLLLSFDGFVACIGKLRKLFDLYESEGSLEVKEHGINTWLLRFIGV